MIEKLKQIDEILDPNRGKLVRDKIPSGDPNKYDIGSSQVLEPLELKIIAAANKLREESGEVLEAARQWVAGGTNQDQDRDKLLEELADVKEVLLVATRISGFSEEDLEEKRKWKEAKNGGFEKWLFMNSKRRKDGTGI
ncbi:MAG: nucleoside triphosphate pyrophosphohydrolase [Microgenomates group bacterium]|jgi:predicted house-cleaning noncanonical NTP pyrophosphatase (MazG superfamily)